MSSHRNAAMPINFKGTGNLPMVNKKRKTKGKRKNNIPINLK